MNTLGSPYASLKEAVRFGTAKNQPEPSSKRRSSSEAFSDWLHQQPLEPITPESVSQHDRYEASPAYQADFQHADSYWARQVNRWKRQAEKRAEPIRTEAEQSHTVPGAFDAPFNTTFWQVLKNFVQARETEWSQVRNRIPSAESPELQLPGAEQALTSPSPNSALPPTSPEPPVPDEEADQPVENPAAQTSDPKPPPLPAEQPIPPATPARRGLKRDVPVIVFPAVQWVKNALFNQAQRHKAEAKAYKAALQHMKAVQVEMREAEEAMRQTNPAREQYIMSHQPLPPELKAEVTRLSDRIAEVKARLSQATQVNSEARKPFFVAPRNAELQSLQKTLDAQYAQVKRTIRKTGPKMELPEPEGLALLQELMKLQDRVGTGMDGMVNDLDAENGEFSERVNYLDESLVARLDGIPNPKAEKGYQAKRKKMLVMADKLSEKQVAFYSLPPEQQSRLMQKLQDKTKEAEIRANIVINHPEAQKSHGLMLRAMEQHLGSQINDEQLITQLFAIASNYSHRLLSPAQKTRARKNLKQLLEKYANRAAPPDVKIKTRIKEHYNRLREVGQVSYTQSITELIHDPESVYHYPVDKGFRSGGWIYREPPMFMPGFCKALPERMSGRIIAHPEAIRLLDELAIEHDFIYKVPSPSQGWKRQDPLSIYFFQPFLKFRTHPVKESIALVAKALQPFIKADDDTKLLGEAIHDNKGHAYTGVKTDLTPSVSDMANLVTLAGQIDPFLEKAVRKELDVQESLLGTFATTSPGVMGAIQALMDELVISDKKPSPPKS